MTGFSLIHTSDGTLVGYRSQVWPNPRSLRRSIVKKPSTRGFCGADDGNRTRVFSLGIRSGEYERVGSGLLGMATCINTCR